MGFTFLFDFFLISISPEKLIPIANGIVRERKAIIIIIINGGI